MSEFTKQLSVEEVNKIRIEYTDAYSILEKIVVELPYLSPVEKQDFLSEQLSKCESAIDALVYLKETKLNLLP